MKKLCAAAVLALALGASFAAAAETPLPKPEILTEETVFTGTRLSAYDTVVIKDFSTDGAQYDNIDSEERPKVEAMKPLLVKTVTESLAMELKTRKLFRNVETNSSPAGKVLLVEGKFVEFNGGSRALRFWVGFGAGKTYLRVTGRLVDAATGKELATFEDRETGFKGVASMESFDDLFPHQAKSLGENLANFIQKLY